MAGISLSQEKLSASLRAIYAAAAGLRPWPEALQSLTTLGLGHTAHLFTVNGTQGIPFQMAHNTPQESLDAYASHYLRICPRWAYVTANPHCNLYYDAVVDRQRAAGRAEFDEWIEQATGGPYFVAGMVQQEDGERVLLSMHRRRRIGRAEPDDLRLFSLVREHLADALRIQRQFQRARGQAESLEQLVDISGGATLLLDASGRVTFANSAAQAILRQDEGLAIAGGALRAAIAKEHDTLRSTLAQAIRDPLLPAGGKWTVSITRCNGRSPLILRVVRLLGLDDIASRGSRPVVAVFISEAAAARLDGFDLTPAERRVIWLLQEGMPLKRAASALGITYNTARLHLARAMRKTGTHRQLDLVRLVPGQASTAAPPQVQ
jgi:DNA-binding CsgD family transcriptional regulator